MTSVAEWIRDEWAWHRKNGLCPPQKRSTVRAIEFARRHRVALIDKLGGKCHTCGRTDRLEFDHLEKRTWRARDLNRWMRIIMYEREAEQGIIALACRSCNARSRPRP